MPSRRIWARPIYARVILAVCILLSLTTTVQSQSEWGGKRIKCYSCASENLKENFIGRERGPKHLRKKNEPKIFDNMCDLDLWLLRERSQVDCAGPCFKWQQVVNNSGAYSYATFRGCYPDLFETDLTNQFDKARTCTTEEAVLRCLDYSTVIENTCMCDTDFCNAGMKTASTFLVSAIIIAAMNIH